jgi:hypothetical protein
MLTEFFTLASDAVFSCGGTIDKFIGDAVMAFFGAPLDQPDHADRAVAAALKIREGMSHWNRERSTRGEGPLEIRIALNTGRGDRRRHRVRAARGLHGARQRGERRGAARGVRRAARRHRDRPETWAAVRDRFEVTQLGYFSLKGLSAQVPLYNHGRLVLSSESSRRQRSRHRHRREARRTARESRATSCYRNAAPQSGLRLRWVSPQFSELRIPGIFRVRVVAPKTRMTRVRHPVGTVRRETISSWSGCLSSS